MVVVGVIGVVDVGRVVVVGGEGGGEGGGVERMRFRRRW